MSNSGNNEKGILDLKIEDSIRDSYMDYAMSVIVGRALPDVRDGLKPVHRRILYSMSEIGLSYNRKHRKSANVVGDVIGKYHPHGDSAIYNAMVRMAQDFSLRYPLVDGQGNFGSIDGDSAAAYRYTEARMSRIAAEMLKDIDKDTVDFLPNYDGNHSEPSVMPTLIPNLLINGTVGIAVGMATNIPPHNLGEVLDALIHIIDVPSFKDEDLFNIVKGPDFPTGATIMGRQGILNAYKTGRGSIKVKAKTHFETRKNGLMSIIITEIPYFVNKSVMVERISELVREKIVLGISELRDESDREGIRVVIDVKRSENEEIVLNQLYKHTQMETSFGMNMVALVNNRPCTLNLRSLLTEFLSHRVEVVTRRTSFLLNKAEARLHIIEGLKTAVANIDEVVDIIKRSPDTHAAKKSLIAKFLLSEIQTQAILDMRLARLTGLEVEKLEEEFKALLVEIERYKDILGNRSVLMQLIKDELILIRSSYSDERRTVIEDSYSDFNMEDLIPNEETIVTISHSGYIKRTLLSNFQSQRRGGKGKSGASSKSGDFITNIISTTNHADLFILTSFGKVHFLKVYNLPEMNKNTRGRHITNFLKLDSEERIVSIFQVDKDSKDCSVMFATKKGRVKRTYIKDYASGRSGMIAIKLNEGDEIVTCITCNDDNNIFMATSNGNTIQFAVSDVRPQGRNAAGVKGISLKEDDSVVSLDIVNTEMTILTVTEKGYGKRSPIEAYRIQSRGGKGLKLCKVTRKTGVVVGALQIMFDEDVMIMTSTGKAIRLSVGDIPVIGRYTQGVKLMDTGDNHIVSFASVKEDDEDDEFYSEE